VSLRDALLKQGIVNKKQAQKVQNEQQKKEYDAKKNKELQDQLQQERQNELKAIEEEERLQREKDTEKNKERDRQLAERESRYRARQMLVSQSVNERGAQIPYFFAEKNIIRKIWVSSWQQECLARGKLGIGRPIEDLDEFALVPRTVAVKVLEICQEKILLLHSELSVDEPIE
jgi:uncharacterized protein YaiL (DUF2058 family)